MKGEINMKYVINSVRYLGYAEIFLKEYKEILNQNGFKVHLKRNLQNHKKDFCYICIKGIKELHRLISAVGEICINELDEYEQIEYKYGDSNISYKIILSDGYRE